MFKPNTVFVVGAGASKEFGLPLGSGLAASIVHNLTVTTDRAGYGAHYVDRRTEDLLRHRYKGQPEGLDGAFEAGALIQKGILHAQSIDAFIDMHADKPGVATVGKLQIALEILRAEKNSELAVDRSNTLNRIEVGSDVVAGSWLRVFTEILLEKAKATDTSSIGRGVTIVCFNYDRCIEHYLIEAIEATLGLTYQEAHTIVYGMNIIHPYGSLGRLPSSRGGRDGIDFGADPDHGTDIWQIADGLSTFTEEMGDQDQVTKIRWAIGQAHMLVFLGFGFQIQNVQLLSPDAASAGARISVGISTGIGIHDVAKREVRGRIRSVLTGATYDEAREAIMLDVGCGDLMRYNRLTLSGT